MDPTLAVPPPYQIEAMRVRFEALLQRDLDHVAQGYYPAELLFQLPARRYLKQLPGGVLEWPRVMRRKARGRYQDLPSNVELDDYPAYYRRNFHWQSDGWLSERSAELYDVGVEFLFLGTADIMRRMVIPHVVDASRSVARPRVLDLACGTGRFLKQLRAALPRARLYGLDLSPFYLRKAHRVLQGCDVSLLNDNAESPPVEANSMDCVTSVFLFHELPKDARRNVMRATLRALRPGGTFVICDSAQYSDANPIAEYLDGFPQVYHEPYYKGYLNDELSVALAECGFEVQSSESIMVSKVVVATKSTTQSAG